ncbi:MAG: MFS transporter, partial [Alphaproteobacteria bacterium]
AVGIIAAADMFPTFIMSPISGAFADRLDRRRMLFWIQFLSMLQAIALAVLWFAGLVTFEILVGLTVLLGILTGANHPVRMAMLPSLVKNEDLPAAVAITSVIFVAMTLLGPAIGAAVFHTFGIGVAFIVNVLGFLAILVSVMMLRLPPQMRAEPHKRGFIGSVAEGIGYVARHAGLRAIIMITLTTSFFAWPVREL